MKHALGVPGEVLHTNHGRVLPESELVLGEAVGGEDLLLVLVPLQRTNLAVGVHVLQQRASLRVPEANLAIGNPATTSQKIALVRRPSECLDSRAVVLDVEARSALTNVPNAKLVVVAARSQLLPVQTPLQTANFVCVSLHLVDHVVCNTNIMVQNHGVTAARSENWSVPGKGPHAGAMAAHGAHLALRLAVPNLNDAVVGADSEVVALLSP